MPNPSRKNVKQLVKTFGSQRKVADYLGVHPSTVSRIISGKIEQPSKNVRRKASRRASYERQNYAYQYAVKVKLGDGSSEWYRSRYFDFESADEELDVFLTRLYRDYSVDEVKKVNISGRRFK